MAARVWVLMLVCALAVHSVAYDGSLVLKDVSRESSSVPPSPYTGVFLTSCDLGRCGTHQVSSPCPAFYTDRCYLVGGTYQEANFTALAINTASAFTGNTNFSVRFYNSRSCTSDKDVIGVIGALRLGWCQPMPLVVISTINNVTYKQPFQLQGVVVEQNTLISPSPSPTHKSSGDNDFPMWAILAVSLGGGAALLGGAILVAAVACLLLRSKRRSSYDVLPSTN